MGCDERVTPDSGEFYRQQWQLKLGLDPKRCRLDIKKVSCPEGRTKKEERRKLRGMNRRGNGLSAFSLTLSEYFSLS